MQKAQECADEALHRTEQLKASRDQLSATSQLLETQLRQAQDALRECTSDRGYLLACVCLLLGTLFPNMEQLRQLSAEKKLLTQQLESHRKLEGKVSQLVGSILTDIGSKGGEREGVAPRSGSNYHPLLRFRKMVIVVLATQRLKRIASQSSRTFRLSGSVALRVALAVHVSARGEKKGTKRGGYSLESVKPPQRLSERELLSWLRSEEVRTPQHNTCPPVELL